MKTSIVITSIFPPTEAVIKFAEMKNYRVIVVGDRKSPESYRCAGVNYLKFNDQNDLGFKITSLLPINHYCRKMIGYLHAIKGGANAIIDTDDDNIPKIDWEFPKTCGKFVSSGPDLGHVNVYSYFTEKKIWPRGLPLGLINKSNLVVDSLKLEEYKKVGIWQGLADEDPDVDAIWRLVFDELVYFDDKEPIVLDAGTIAPFNSQNTWVCEELFPIMYLPTHVTFRFTDILRGLVAQPIMWAHGYNLGFSKASVLQKRNPHDYMEDFISEIPMYENSERVIDCVSSVVNSDQSIESNLRNSYLALKEIGVVVEEEIEVLDAWLDDLAVLEEHKREGCD